jgi:hypothetical protein
MAFYGLREHENKLMAPIPMQKSSEVIFFFGWKAVRSLVHTLYLPYI